MDSATTLLAGDVCVVRTNGFAGALIRLGAALLGRPNMRNHVAIVHHRDAAGTLWGIEARPGGVGWVDMADYLASSWTISNAAQPKTDEQRAAIAKTAEAMLQVPYDWTAIAADAMHAIRADRLWRARGYGLAVPAQVVCSSLADYLYSTNGLASPDLTDGDGVRFTTPADWDLFIETEGWRSSTS